jgi:hypothetical protein
VFVVRVWRRAIERGTDTEYYCVCCEGLGSAIYRGINTVFFSDYFEFLEEGNI